jgi:hypothetical protein
MTDASLILQLIFFILILSPIVIIPIWLLYIYSSFLNLNGLMRELGGKITIDGKAVFQFRGKEIFVRYKGISRRGTPATLGISTKGAFGGRLLIRRRSSWDRFYKKIGLNRELENSDPELFSDFYFECDDQEFLNQLLLNKEIKDRALKLLSYFSYIKIVPTSCLFKKCPAEQIASISKENILGIANEMLDFSAQIPTTGGSHAELAIRIKSYVLYFLGTTILFIGIMSLIIVSGGLYAVTADPELWIRTSEYCLAICLVVLVGAFFMIKGFSTSSKVLHYFLWSFCFGAFFIAWYGYPLYEGIFFSRKLVP